MRIPICAAGACRQWSRGVLVAARKPLLRPALGLRAVRWNSSKSPYRNSEGGEPPGPNEVLLEERIYKIDEWMNTPPSILAAIPRRLHLQPNHPLSITRKLIESRFPSYETHNGLFPVVTTRQNFDSLGFPPDHIGRSRTDTYYLNKYTVLRTHTSAHQAGIFRKSYNQGHLVSADVYRRDAIDRSHYPVFHQMEGTRTWDRSFWEEQGKKLAQVIWQDVENIPKHNISIEDPNPAFHAERNPLQASHSADEVEAVAAHLKRSLEDVVVTIFNAAKSAGADAESTTTDNEPLRVRWVEAYFPFTSPSWELEVFWQGDWLEVLGCGVVSQPILDNANEPNRIGWAFGIGLERIAMLLYSIPDIRLFWSKDPRFLSQFSEDQPIRRFVPFSKYPACFKDVSFWLQSSSNAGGGAAGNHPSASPSVPASPSAPASNTATTETSSSSAPIPPAAPAPTTPSFHENDVMEIAREVCGDLVEDVRLTDEFVHPKTGRRSKCYRINYRSLERTLTNDETNGLHERLCALLVQKLGVELR
ncbi:phenylalanyl-tRNA synthetase [Plenodomus tracheiphilus IPT5]|uniref:Phenylalanine--tRNA ligase, mitochondrial n=1 Tax=Plenodomus tracheiphilus IPT5 TaxID=1408161 RepID=A0A6A7AXE4_9PLEO|nr:phenylalanyl-tRNA synthetase [Plenodomus tracheiphilus IPT5]